MDRPFPDVADPYARSTRSVGGFDECTWLIHMGSWPIENQAGPTRAAHSSWFESVGVDADDGSKW